MSEGQPHLSLRSINHVSKVCSNLAASVAFYRDVLGFILVKRPSSFNDSFEGCWLWRFGLGLHLIQGKPVPRPREIDPKSDHLSFQADSLEDVEQQLLSHGLPYVRQHVVEDGVEVQQMFFHDPDNNMIEVCNCDCLPIIPLDLGRCHTCAAEANWLAGHAGIELHQPQMYCSRHTSQQQCGIGCQADDDDMSDGGSRDSMDSSQSLQQHHHQDGSKRPLLHLDSSLSEKLNNNMFSNTAGGMIETLVPQSHA